MRITKLPAPRQGEEEKVGLSLGSTFYRWVQQDESPRGTSRATTRDASCNVFYMQKKRRWRRRVSLQPRESVEKSTALRRRHQAAVNAFVSNGYARPTARG